MPGRGEWDLVVGGRAAVGEGPVWEHSSQSLLWVDIFSRVVHRLDPASGRTWSRQLDQMVGAALPRRAGGLVLCLEDGVWLTDTDDGPARRFAPIEADVSTSRLNDAKTDRRGRLWAGTMATDERDGAGTLYRIDVDGTVTAVHSPVTISNGIGWSVDDRSMYYIDSAHPRIYAFDYDVTTGEASHCRVLADLAPSMGIPDGMAVDAEGHIWVAFYGGWAVRRFTPAGVLDRTIELPVSNVTSCAFGGPGLTDLYVTSAAARLSEADLLDQPMAGGLFAVRPGVAGVPVTPFAG